MKEDFTNGLRNHKFFLAIGKIHAILNKEEQIMADHKNDLFDIGYNAVTDELNEHNDHEFSDLCDLFAGAFHKVVTFAKCADLPDGIIYELVHNAINCEREIAAEEAAAENPVGGPQESDLASLATKKPKEELPN